MDVYIRLNCNKKKVNQADIDISNTIQSYTPLAKLLARQARPGTTQYGSGNTAGNYSSISATNQYQLRQKMYQ